MRHPVGSDRRITRHPASRGAIDADRFADRPRVAVVGAGIAGLSAATGLAERGVHVDVLERTNQLGGRVASWQERTHDGEITMSRGFHAFFRQYYNLRRLLQRADPDLKTLVAVDDYPLIDAQGRTDSFRGLPRKPPWNALAFAVRSPSFRWRDLIALNVSAAAPLATVSVPSIYHRLDHLDAESFLNRIGFPDAARHLAFSVFSRSFFATPTDLSAAELATMFHFYFLGSSEGLLFDVPDGCFEKRLWAPLHRYLITRGVNVRIGTSVTAVEPLSSGDFEVHTADGSLKADGVVLATDVSNLRDIVEASPHLGEPRWRARISRLRAAPPFVVQRLWLDRPVSAHRPAFLGIGGLDPLDNITVLERYEHEAAQWARRRGGSVVELHAYATTGSPTATAARLLERLRQVYPETSTTSVVEQRVLAHQDCPLFGVGDFSHRPPVQTPCDRLVLAGDCIRVDLPVALMERAATTGWQAANCLLSRWNLAGHDLYTVPNHGRLKTLERIAARGGKQ